MASSAATETPSTASSIARPPAIDTAIQPVNEEPVELDSTPVSPAEARKLNKKGFSPDFDDEAIDELAGVKGEGVKEREKRAALLTERSRNPAVLVDIPQTPGAEELAVAVRSAATTHEDPIHEDPPTKS